MKKLIILASVLLMGTMLMSFAKAEDIRGQQAEAVGVTDVEGQMPDEAKDILGDISVMDSLDFGGSLEKIKDDAVTKLKGFMTSGLHSASVILIVVLLCSLTGSLYSGGAVPDFVPLGCAVVISSIAVGDIKGLIGLGSETLTAMSDFSKVLLPSLAASASAAGAITSASAKYAATALFMDILISVAAQVILPLIYTYIAVIIANAAVGNEALAGVQSLIKWVLTSLITVLMIVFTAYLGVTGVISGTSDAVATRVAKTTISTVLPVVGGIIADAAGTVLGGAAVLKNALGVFGMLVIICLCLGPFLNLGVHYLLYKAAAGLSQTMSDKRLGGLIGGIGSAFGFVMALVGSCAIMLFFSIISSIKVVGA